MSLAWGARWRSFFASGKNLRNGWLIAAAIVALYIGAIRPQEEVGGINNSKAIGLASSEPIAFWRQTRPLLQLGAVRERNVDNAGIVGGTDQDKPQTMAFLSAPASPAVEPQNQEADRKTVRTSTIDLLVQKPAESADKIRILAENLGGFLIESQVTGGQDATSASLTIRVPAAHFDQARAEICKLGLRIEGERTEAQDVTRQYVDQEANLRNLRAEEAQYLGILKQAKTVKDTLDVSEKLSAVRGQIEQRQAEFAALSKQVETVSIAISLRTESEARVFGLNWRPLYQMKLSLRDGLDGLANYASTMMAFLFLLPTVLLWLATLVLGCAVGWRLLRWMARRWFGWKAAEVPVRG